MNLIFGPIIIKKAVKNIFYFNPVENCKFEQVLQVLDVVNLMLRT